MNLPRPLRRLLPASVSASLLRLAAAFLGLFALALTLAPAVRQRSLLPLAELRWAHWLGVVVWVLALFWLDRRTREALPNRDPFIIPVAGLLAGWGLLTIWRLTFEFGLRQTAWLAVSCALFVLALRYRERILPLLRRYKYVWLLAGLLITALTFLFGTNPSGIGPDLWLGCCGLYFQPSELLKLLLIIYLAAYLADRQPLMTGLLPLLAPTAVMTGAVLLLLMVQRDLGTAWVFVFIYTILIYIAAGRRRVLLASALVLVLAMVAGYELVGLVHARIDSWLNPWVDPTNRSYQIVQALMAIAAGGMFGRGPGLGSPGFVPVAHSDFIYTSIVEESGLLGAIALLALVAFLVVRALRISLHARDAYQRYLAIGLAAYIASQSLLIIGGNIRMLPLTGVTLPFVSYGGSSMLISFFALLLLCLVSHDGVHRSAPVLNSRPTLIIAGLLLGAFALAAAITGWWGVVRGPDLLTRTDNARRGLSDRYVWRGALLDRDYQPLSRTGGSAGDYTREYVQTSLGNVLGYSHPQFGQSGLEDGLDPILRGEERQPAWGLWLNHILYGRPSPGLDVQLSLDLELTLHSMDALEGQRGAAVVMDAASGEVLALASQPGFSAASLSDDWQSLLASQDSPLLNRAVQGAYPPGGVLGPWLLAAARSQNTLPQAPAETAYVLNELALECTRPPLASDDWDALVEAACPGALAQLGLALGEKNLMDLYTQLGLYSAPDVPLRQPAFSAPASLPRPGEAATGQAGMLVSPLQLARVAATLSNGGQLPAAQLALAVKDASGEWQPYAEPAAAQPVLSSAAAFSQAQRLAAADAPIWEMSAYAFGTNGRRYAWYLAGSLSRGDQPARVIAVLLEDSSTPRAISIGRAILLTALGE
ncbi:MAG: FtsW/RodA/SpoVE family cell cycle protein [Anaerolineales bacterium]|nr:MAG: FtsW/RodA/SpoVE family cell cycle protein [Anaerolineales bacterium]